MYNQNGMQPWYPQSNGYNQEHQMKSMCKQYQDYYVVGQMNDGSQVEGIVEDMDDDSVTMLVPEMIEEDELMNNRLFGGNGVYGGYGRRRFRRFRRRRFPFAAFVFPFIFPYPYYY